MNGIFLHSPHQPCRKDCYPSSPCSRKGEEVIIRGSPVVACVHLTTAEYRSHSTTTYLSPNSRTMCKTPTKTITPSKTVSPSHSKGCSKKIPSIPCPFGRCEGKYENISQHFKQKHDFIKLTLNVPLVYRLRNISRDRFIIHEPKHDVFFLGNIEESYQKNIYFEMQVIYNYKKKCCGHPKFVLTIPGVVSNHSIDVYKNKHTIGKTVKIIEILKDKLKRTTDMKMYYDMNIIVRTKF